jgi:2'-5' RNA ligase
MASASSLSSAREFSIWLVPSRVETPQLTAEIVAASAAVAAPTFSPHVTLLTLAHNTALNDVQEVCSALARAHHSLQVAFTGIEAGADTRHWRFRCVFFKVDAHDGLTRLHEAAKASLPAIAPGDSYFPHLSLCYSDCDADTRGAVRDAAARRVSASPIQGALLDRIQIWDCGGPIEGWHKVAEYELSPSVI